MVSSRMAWLTRKEQPDSEEAVYQLLHPLVKEWFTRTFPSLSLPQRYAVREIHERRNVLITAPTGSTKTLTAFLSILNHLIILDEQNLLEDRVYAIYISPLKALNYDIAVNLLKPFQEMEAIAGRKLGVRIGVRTGDTSQAERQRMLRKPPHILITTPESLAILLTSPKFRNHLHQVEWLVVDEIHALAENKRGSYLSLLMEELQRISPQLARVGLSATISPLEEVALFLAGFTKGQPRKTLLIDVQYAKSYDLKVLSPVDDYIHTPPSIAQDRLYTLLDQLIQQHRTTLIFTNTRSATERVVNHLKERFPKKYAAFDDEQGSLIGAHHSSLSRDVRFRTEQLLREGKLKAVVSSTSLELGIDIGYVDLVVLLGSPKSVARALQRIGRAGHRLHETSKGRIIVLDRDDLVECSVLVKEAVERHIDRIHIPQNPLDVLSQLVYAFTIIQEWNVQELYDLVRRSYSFHTLSWDDYLSVIHYLAGAYGLEEKNVYAKITYDEATGMIRRRGRLARMLFMTNTGTIPDESYITVKIHGSGQVVGKLDEFFLERLRKGDVFVLGGEKYVFLHARGMTAFVKPAVDVPPTIPHWVSEMLPLSYDLALAIGRFRKNVQSYLEAGADEQTVKAFIAESLLADEHAVNALYTYLKEQYDFYAIPHHEHIIAEHYEEDGYQYLLVNSIYGRRVNDVLSRAFALLAGKLLKRDVRVGVTDHGFYLLSHERIQLERIIPYLRADKLRVLMREAIMESEALARRFRHAATRGLMILRQYKGREKSAGRQQLSSMRLLRTVREHAPDFPLLREAVREVLEDMMDITNATEVVRGIENGRIRVEEVSIGLPSPFALGLLTSSKSDLIRMEDRIAFLQRMHQLIQAKIQLNKQRGRKT